MSVILALISNKNNKFTQINFHRCCFEVSFLISDGRVFLLALRWYFLFFKFRSYRILFAPKEGFFNILICVIRAIEGCIVRHDKKCLANVPYIALRSSQPI